MFKLNEHKILWCIIPFTFLLFLLGSKGAIDLHQHDTYLVISARHVVLVLSILLFVLGGIYYLLRKHKLLYLLNIIHVSGTVAGAILLVILTIMQTINRPDNITDSFLTSSSSGVTAIVFLVLIQLVLLINVIIGLIRGKRRED